MATNNLLVNNEARVLREEQQKVERSAHNLSQSRKFPCEVGLIYPFFCRKTLPSDSFKISTNILIKQLQPLLVPQMVSFTVNTAFYWVDYSLAFPDFEYFLINQKGTQDIELPYFKRPYRLTSDSPYVLSDDATLPTVLPNSISSFLDFSINSSNEKVDALPVYSYYRIYRDFYLPVDRLSEETYHFWFPGNGKDVLFQGANYSFGNLGLNGNSLSFCVPFHDILPHVVRGDYFVNSYPTPLRGDVPTLVNDVDISQFTAKLNAGIDLKNILDKPIYVRPSEGLFAQSDNKNLELREQNSSHRSSRLVGEVGSDNFQPALSFSNNTTEGSYLDTFGSINLNFRQLSDVLSSNRYVSFSNVSSLQNTFSITSRQLRLLESLTRKREIDILMKPRLKNYLQTYFGVNRYKDDSLYQPVFIGSTTQHILINDIAQTTPTSDSPLGRQGATAMSLGSGYVGEYYCRNYGCLMGVMYILPDYDYEPGLPKEWSERTPDDFVNPEFSHLSMQPILNKELYVSDDSTWNNKVLGYGGMYDSYRTSQNLVCGDFLNQSLSDIRQYAQVRRFDNSNKPEITDNFLNSNTAFDKTVFSVPSMPPFIAQCVTRIEAVRPIPQVAIPRG